MPKRSDNRLTKRPATAHVIPWEPDVWGVAIDRGDGKHDAYMVGPREQAEAEARRVRAGAPPSIPPNA
jgi:hypothetical protein